MPARSCWARTRRPACRSRCARAPTATMCSSARQRQRQRPTGAAPVEEPAQGRREKAKARRRRRPRKSPSAPRCRAGCRRPTSTLETALGAAGAAARRRPHPETGEPIIAGIGRFGPYLKHGDAYKSLGGDDDVLTIGLNRAVALLAEPAKGGRRTQPGKALGNHPADAAPITLAQRPLRPLHPPRQAAGLPAQGQRARRAHPRRRRRAAGRQGGEGQGRQGREIRRGQGPQGQEQGGAGGRRVRHSGAGEHRPEAADPQARRRLRRRTPTLPALCADHSPLPRLAAS